MTAVNAFPKACISSIINAGVQPVTALAEYHGPPDSRRQHSGLWVDHIPSFQDHRRACLTFQVAAGLPVVRLRGYC